MMWVSVALVRETDLRSDREGRSIISLRLIVVKFFYWVRVILDRENCRLAAWTVVS